MAGTPLGIGLAIDFAGLDADLQKVADHIERTGKEAAVKVGTLAGMAIKGDLNGDYLAAQVSKIGISLSQGMAGGVRTSSALMMSMGARINAMLDRLVGAAITMFSRIDASMKFPRWDAFLSRAHLRLRKAWSGSKEAITVLDTAMAGGFGGTAATITKIFKALFDNLARDMTAAMAKAGAAITESMGAVAKTITTQMNAAVQSIAENTAKLAQNLRAGEANARGLADEIQGIAATAPLFEKFGAMGSGMRGTRGRPMLRPKGLVGDIPAPTPPAPPTPEIIGRVAKPNLTKDMIAAFQQMAGWVTQAIAKVKELNAYVKESGGHVRAIGHAFGGWGQLIALPLGALEKFLGVSFRLVAGVLDLGTVTTRTVARIRGFFSSLRSVADKTYSDLYEGHNLFTGTVLASVKTVTHLVRGLWDLGTGRAFRRVSDEANEFGQSVRRSTSQLGKLIGAVGRLGTEFMAALGVAGMMFKVVQFFTQGVKGASDLNETVSRSQVVFGASFGQVDAQADQLQKSFGLVKKEQLDIASGFGGMAQGAGLSEQATADLSNKMTKFAADMSSSVNIPLEEAGDKLRSALAGEAEPLRKFGANITETRMQAYALAHGLAKSKDAISDQAKITARAALITEDMSYVQNDMDRTAGSAANQFRKAGGGVTEFMTQIGTLLLPAIQTATVVFNEFLGTIIEVFQNTVPVVQGWVGAVSEAFGAVGMVIRNAGAFWRIAQLQIGAFVTNAIAWIGVLPQNIGPIWDWLKRNWWNLLTDMLSALKAFGTNLLTNAANLGAAIWDALKNGGAFEFTWTPLLDGFKATTEKLPELIRPDLVDVSEEISTIIDGIGKKEAERIKNKADFGAAPKKKGPISETDKEKDKEYKLGGALEVGTKEAFSAISKGMTGRTNDKMKESITVQKDIAKTAKEHLDVAKKQGAAAPALQVK